MLACCFYRSISSLVLCVYLLYASLFEASQHPAASLSSHCMHAAGPRFHAPPPLYAFGPASTSSTASHRGPLVPAAAERQVACDVEVVPAGRTEEEEPKVSARLDDDDRTKCARTNQRKESVHCEANFSHLLGCEAFGQGLLRGTEELLDLSCRWHPCSASHRGCRSGQSHPTVALWIVRGLTPLLVAEIYRWPARRRRLPPELRKRIEGGKS